MHPSSYERMDFLATRLLDVLGRPVRVLDLGSYDVNGCYRPIFEKAGGVTYLGLDMAAGPNVDVVMTDPYRIPVGDASQDLVVSGQTFEHIEFPWLTIQEVARVVRPGGAVVLTTPSAGPEHRHPFDCYRYYPDGMRALGKWAGLTCANVWRDLDDMSSAGWNDIFAVFWKGAVPAGGGFEDVAELPVSSATRWKRLRRSRKRISAAIRGELTLWGKRRP